MTEPKTTWKETVMEWFRGYSEQEKLLVLETQEGMINFIDSLLATAHQSGIEEGRKQVIEEIEVALPKEIIAQDKLKTIIENTVCMCEYENYPFCETERIEGVNETVQKVRSILTNLKNK